MDQFAGRQHHSSQHGGGADYAGQRVVVIGSNNSAHDICADLVEHGADATMVQRSSTLVARTDTLLRGGWGGGLYCEEAVESGVDADTADLLGASVPIGSCRPCTGRSGRGSLARTPPFTIGSAPPGSNSISARMGPVWR